MHFLISRHVRDEMEKYPEHMLNNQKKLDGLPWLSTLQASYGVRFITALISEILRAYTVVGTCSTRNIIGSSTSFIMLRVIDTVICFFAQSFHFSLTYVVLTTTCDYHFLHKYQQILYK